MCGLPGFPHEEVITELVSREIRSYKQLPLTLYQIQTKFRNEERPRFGVLRTSEFLMKDAYSFSASLEELNEIYEAMYKAYCRIFERCGLEYIPVEAESGPIGGDASHEFMAPAPNGEDVIVRCTGCSYAANRERAETGRSAIVPSAVDSVSGPVVVETPDATSIDAVSEMLKHDPSSFIKTLVYVADDTPVAVLIRGDHEANEGKIRRALGVSDLGMADDDTVEDVTGAPVGYAGPCGLKCSYITDHDIAAMTFAVTGANAKDAHLTGVVPGTHFELSETYDLRNAAQDDPCPRCSARLEIVQGIEVGHVFKLGTRYSEALNATWLDPQEKKHPMIMGCYGIGVTRVVAAIVETCHDDDGIIWPPAVAPFLVELIPLNVTDEAVMNVTGDIYDELVSSGLDVLMDDRDQRPGFKFKDADLIGLPLRMVIGSRGLQDGIIEVKRRTDSEAVRVPLADAASYVRTLAAQL